MNAIGRLVAVATAVAALAPVRTGYVVGFVQDAACTPISGVRVSAEGTKDEVVTDNQGRFVISVPDERTVTAITARLAGFRTFTRTGVRIGPGSRDSHTLTLDTQGASNPEPIIDNGRQPRVPAPPDRRLHGEVMTVSCMPIADAELAVMVRGAKTAVRSDSAGRFAFAKVPPGTYDLKAQAEGYIPVLRKGTLVSSETPRVRILLERGADGVSDIMLAK